MPQVKEENSILDFLSLPDTLDHPFFDSQLFRNLRYHIVHYYHALDQGRLSIPGEPAEMRYSEFAKIFILAIFDLIRTFGYANAIERSEQNYDCKGIMGNSKFLI